MSVDINRSLKEICTCEMHVLCYCVMILNVYIYTNVLL